MAMVLFYYSFSLLPFAFIRILSFHMFARNEGGVYLRVALFLYGLNIGFDLLYVAVFRMGAKGIPLGLFSSALCAAWLTFHRNICDLRSVMDRSLALFASKVLVGAVSCAAVVGLLQVEAPAPASGWGDFVYLCLLCGAGSLVFFLALIWTHALPKAWWTIFNKSADDL